MAEYSLGTAHGTVKIDSDTSGLDEAGKKLDQTKASAENTGASLSKTATVMGAAGAVIAGGLGVAVMSAANFEQRLSAIKAVSGATAGEMSKISDKALQIGKDTSFSATEAAQAMEELAKAGISTTDILGGAADATVALAAAGEVDLPTAATIASNAMNQFGLTAQDMVGVVDKIAGAANASAIDVGDFGMSMSQVGAVANLAGLSFDDTAVAIAEMGNAGIKGSDAGTSLKTMLSNLQPSTEKAANAMKDLGIITEDGTNRFYDAQGNLKSLGEIQGILQDSTKNLTAAQKQQALETIFGSDAIRAAAVMADQGAAGYDKMNAAIDKTSAADVAKTRMDNLKGSLEQVKGSVETVAIQFGMQLLPAIRGLLDGVDGLFSAFIGLSDGQREAIVTGMAVAAAVLLVGAALIKSYQAVQSMRTAITALNIVMRANPMLAVIGLILLLVTALVTAYTTSETFRNIVNAAFQAVGAAIGWVIGVFQPLIDKITALGSLVGGYLKPVLEWLGNFFSAVFSGAVSLASSALQSLGTWIADNESKFRILVITLSTLLLPTLASMALAAGAAALSMVASAATTVASWVGMAIGATVNGAIVAAQWLLMQARALLSVPIMVFQALLVVGSWIGMGIAAVANAAIVVGQWVLMGLQAVAQAAVIAGAWLLSNGVGMVTALASLAVAVASTIAGWIVMAAGALAGAASMALAWFIALGPIGWAIAALLAVVAVVILFWDDLKGYFKSGADFLMGVLQWLGGAISAAWAWIVGVFQAAGSAILGAVQNASAWVQSTFNSMISWMRGIPGWIMGIFAGAAGWLIGAGQGIISGLWNGVNALLGGFFGAVGGIGRSVIGMFAGAGGWLMGAGWDIVRGLWNGIASGGSWLMGMVRGWANSIVSSIKGMFGIGSPSKVMRDEVGKWLPPGIGEGIKAATPAALGAADTFSQDLVDALQGNMSASMETALTGSLTEGTLAGLLGGSSSGGAGGSAGWSPNLAQWRPEMSMPAPSEAAGGAPVNIELNTYNPVAEKASDTEARKLRAAAAIGRF